jgi:hypothetical protein
MAQVKCKASDPSQESDLPYLHLILGTEYIDSVTIAPGVVISGQSIGVASNSSGFQNLTGFWGEHIIQALSMVRIVSNTFL